MTPTQIEQVQVSWRLIVPHMDTLASLFYFRLFELEPSLKPLFKRDIQTQSHKLVSMLDTAVRNLHQAEKIIPAVQALGRRHVGYGAKPEHYNIVAEALLWTLEQGLGDAFTEEVEQAWTDAYMLLATVMQEAAEETLEEAVA